MVLMKRKHQKTLDLIFTRPISGNIKWKDIESLFLELGAEISEAEGSLLVYGYLANVGFFIVHILHPILIKER